MMKQDAGIVGAANADRTGMPPVRTVSAEEFYVGYLKMPAALRKFVTRLVPALLVLAGGFALFLSRSQRDPGNAVWHDDATPTFVGLVGTTPYPHIRVLNANVERPISTILLVGEGKRGGGAGVEALGGRIAGLRGTILERDHVRLLELSGSDAVTPEAAVSESDAARLRTVEREALGEVTLRGEIIDPKGYCGAMKPGEGKTHKACATLCISGGIPPMFVTFDDAGKRSYYLLASPDGGPLDERILPFVADPVEIRGSLERRDDIVLLKIDPADLRRL